MAEAFGKEHKNVLQDIDRILSQVPEIFGRLNFEPSEYELKNNLGFTVKHPMYIITKDGFTLLTMGYTGEKAMQFKVAYIARFNEMEEQLRSASPAIPDFQNPALAARAWVCGYDSSYSHALRKSQGFQGR